MRPRVDQGKFAKEMKALKPRDARRLDARERLPPHKKERTYVLAVEWTETETRREEHRFTTRAAREEGERRIKKELKRQERFYTNYTRWKDARITYEKKVGPIFTEFVEDGNTIEPAGDKP
jgi:hypothetical protein